MTFLGLANAIGAVVSFVSSAVTNPGNKSGNPGVGTTDLLLFIVYMSVAMPFGYVLGRRLFARATAWVHDDAADPATALTVPWRLASMSLAIWVGAALVFGGTNLAGHDNAVIALRIFLSIVLGGLATSAIAFLLIERAMRPVFVSALARVTPSRRLTLGVRPRLLLSWALGGAVPLLMIGLVFVGRRPAENADAGGAVWFVVGLGVVVGALIVGIAGRSLSDPLDDVRGALLRVQADDLDVELPVDDGGEIGLLQSGVNRMVAGLRERRQLHDLFGRHVGPEVARIALERGVALGGE